MIYIIFILLWIFAADSIWCFIIPVLSLIIRASYRERNLNLFKVAPFIFATILFLANHYLTEKPFTENLLLSIRIVFFSGLLLHIFDSATKGSLNSMPKIQYYVYLSIRFFSIIKERLSDTWLVFKIKRRNTIIKKRPKLLIYTIANFILECVMVFKQIQVIVFEKGGQEILEKKNYSVLNKRTMQIILPRNKKILITYSSMGDIFLLLLIIMTYPFYGLNTIPIKFIHFFEYLSSLL